MVSAADIAYQTIVSVALSLVQLVVGLALAMGSVYLGLNMFDKMTHGIDEMKEIKKGNVAVGLLLAAVIFSIAAVVQGGVENLTTGIPAGASVGVMLVALAVGIIQLLIGILAAVVSIYIAIRVLDRITTDIDEMAELKHGNVAVAVVMAGVLLAVSFVIRAGVVGLTHAVDPVVLASQLGM